MYFEKISHKNYSVTSWIFWHHNAPAYDITDKEAQIQCKKQQVYMSYQKNYERIFNDKAFFFLTA